MVEFSATLSDALAPVTLISGVGLLLDEKKNPKISMKKSTSPST